MTCTLIGCTSDDGEGTTTSAVMGRAVYQDAQTDHAGAAQEPAAPPAQSAKVTVTVEGTGQLPQVDPRCALDTTGAFEASYAGSADVGADHAYVASIGKAAAQIVTPSGCAIPDLTVGVITDVVVRAELTVTAPNCESYCAANARAKAEAQCGATASAAECRGTAEASAQASCTTTCTAQAHAIVAELHLGAGAVGQLDADALKAAALGELSADLVFDHMEDANGAVVGP